MMDITSYEEWLAVETVFLEKVDDDLVRQLYLAAKGGDPDASKKLAGMTIANWGPPLRAMTLQEMKADRAYQILYWLKNNSH